MRQREEQDREQLALVRTSIGTPPVSGVTGHFREDLYGDFAREQRTDGKIVLEGEAASAAGKAAEGFRRGAKYMTNTIIGEKIAAEYDIRTRNFSTQTSIAELPDGRKVFMVYDHRGSWLHRGLDGLMKRLNGLRMRKVSRKEWKAQFESKSTIPVIENEDPDTVLMPFQPNVNAHDVFAKNAEIENFGENGWAKNVDLEGKIGMAESIVDEMKRIHGTGTAWGELILPNVIFTDEKKPIVCDPEVRFDKDVPLNEAKARDLKDLCLSVAAALEHAHGESDYGRTAKAILGRYNDPVVLGELKKLASKKRGVLGTIFFGYEQARTGTKSKKQYDEILKAIREYEVPEAV
ncbi:MAG: hypothetical protein QY323_05615 [Patescibacteria group bacterium]|nr:MAG: hypothetical protein QY323_05615 [Patescibacteria group bacterium]